MIPTVESPASSGLALAGAILAFLVLDLVVTAWVVRLLSDEADRERPAGPVPSDDDARALIDRKNGVVQCPYCEETNEVGYRFCRRCVGELPGGRSVPRPGATPMDRFTP